MNSEHDDISEENELRLRRLKAGAVLVAREALTDPNFDAAMVLICVYSNEGVYGLVLNRPSHMPISEMFDGFSGLDISRRIYIGGPVQQETLQIVHVTDTPMADAYQICPRIHMGGQWNNLGSVLVNTDKNLRLFLGYSGWAAGQLENEIALGAWEVYAIDTESLLSGPEDEWFCGVQRLEQYLKSISLRSS